MDNTRNIVFIGLAVFCLAIAGWLLYPAVFGSPAEVPAAQATPSALPAAAAAAKPTVMLQDAPETTAPMQLLQVSIQGSVMYPGEYYLAPGSTVAEAVELAGGLLDGADTSKLDMDAPVYGNQYIGIP